MADDGTILKGVIHYWAKDYSVRLLKPIKIEQYGAHLIYMIPATYIVDKNIEDYLIIKSGRHYINIYTKCKKYYKNFMRRKNECTKKKQYLGRCSL